MTRNAFVMLCLPITVLGTISPAYPVEKDWTGCLNRTLAELTDRAPLKKEMVSDHVELVWYPKAGYIAFSHVELAVDGVLWDATAGYSIKNSVEVAERAARTGERGFFRFKLNVTEGELNNLRTFLKEREGKGVFQTCVGGACKAIDQTTGIVIPFPFSKVPTLSVIYLTAMQKLGYSRVVKVEYVGKSAFSNLISTEVPWELSITYTAATFAGGLIVTGYNLAGQLVKYVVPLSSAQGSDDEKKNTKSKSFQKLNDPSRH